MTVSGEGTSAVKGQATVRSLYDQKGTWGKFILSLDVKPAAAAGPTPPFSTLETRGSGHAGLNEPRKYKSSFYYRKRKF